MTLGYSRRLFARATRDEKLLTFIRCHEEALEHFAGIPHELLYDNTKSVVLSRDFEGQEIRWNPIFWDFSSYRGFQPRTCRPYRAQTKGKVESGVKYVRRNFLCGLQGREPANLDDLNAQLREWVWKVANQRVHGTTHEVVMARWDGDQFALQPLNGRLPYPYADDELRKVARDAFVHWQGSRYSVPWIYAGREVWVRQQEGHVQVHYGDRRIAAHPPAPRKHMVMLEEDHHAGIPLSARQERKTLVHIRATAPVVEIRPLAAYESLALAGAR